MKKEEIRVIEYTVAQRHELFTFGRLWKESTVSIAVGDKSISYT